MPPTAFVFFGNFLNNSSSGTVYNNSLKVLNSRHFYLIVGINSNQIHFQILIVNAWETPSLTNLSHILCFLLQIILIKKIFYYETLIYSFVFQDHLKMLGEMISYHPTLAEQSQFLFVPGPSDPCSPNIFPRSPLPLHLTAELRNLVPNCKFLTNPARIQYCTQHIVVFRYLFYTNPRCIVLHYFSSLVLVFISLS